MLSAILVRKNALSLLHNLCEMNFMTLERIRKEVTEGRVDARPAYVMDEMRLVRRFI